MDEHTILNYQKHLHKHLNPQDDQTQHLSLNLSLIFIKKNIVFSKNIPQGQHIQRKQHGAQYGPLGDTKKKRGSRWRKFTMVNRKTSVCQIQLKQFKGYALNADTLFKSG